MTNQAESPSPAREKSKLKLIQICRGVAAMCVVLAHMSGSTGAYFNMPFLGNFFMHGYLGVDFFFVLSGFIIMYVHNKDVKSKSNQLSYVKKRLIRIYPIYWVIATVYLIMLIGVAGKTQHMSHVRDFGEFREWLLIAGGYLLLPVEHGFFLPVAWTLAYEVLFYMAFLIFLFVGERATILLLLFWAALVCLNIFYSDQGRIFSLMVLNERILEFLIGCFVALLALRSRFLPDYLGLPLILLAIAVVSKFFPTGLLTGQGIVSIGLLIGLILLKIVQIDIFRKYNYPRILLLIGESSYSIYLSHLIFLSALFRGFGYVIKSTGIDNSIVLHLFAIVLFSLTIFGGVLIYYWIERPLLRFLQTKFFYNEQVGR